MDHFLLDSMYNFWHSNKNRYYVFYRTQIRKFSSLEEKPSDTYKSPLPKGPSYLNI